jgi:hypothetical protein
MTKQEEALMALLQRRTIKAERECCKLELDILAVEMKLADGSLQMRQLLDKVEYNNSLNRKKRKKIKV